MHSIELNRSDDNYALISYVCAYSLQTLTSYIGHIYKVKKPQEDDKLLPTYYYALFFEYADFTLKIELEGLNDLIRTFESRARVRGLMPLIERSLYLINTTQS